MTDRPFSRINYDSRDSAFVQENFGIMDPTPGDGHVKWEEISPVLQDFYRDLPSAEIRAVKRYRLSTHSFSHSHELAIIARKYIKWSFFEENHLPQKIDESLFDETRNFPNPNDRPDQMFDELTIDLKSIRVDEELNDILLNGNLSCLKTITLHILRAFLKENAGKDSFSITRDEWDKAYAIWNCEVAPRHSAETTWQEMISVWHASDPDWNLIMNDHVAGLASGGMVRVAKQDLTITAAGIRAYAANPGRHIFTLPSPYGDSGFSIRTLDLHQETVWPEMPSQFTLMEKMGMSLNLNIEPNSRMIANQNIHGGDLIFNVSEPLFYLEGFHLNVDANNWFTKGVANTGQWFTSWFGKDFDIGLYNLFAITVYHNRICLVFNGDHINDDVIDPIAAQDYLFLDVTDIFRDLLKDFDSEDQLDIQLFDDNGNLYSEIPVSQLQDVLVQVFKSNSQMNTSQLDWQNLATDPNFQSFHNELWVNDIQADFSDKIPQEVQNKVDLFHFGIQRGRVYAKTEGTHQFFIQGQMELSLGLTNDYARKRNGSDIFDAHVEFLMDSNRDLGFAKITIPEILLKGLSDQVDGSYDGEIYVSLPPELFDSFKEGELTAEDILEVIGVHILLDLQKNQQDYLAAAVHFRYEESGGEKVRIQKMMADYQIVFAEGDKKLHGVISGGRFFAMQQVDPDNPYLAQEFEIRSKVVVTGGLIQLIGEDTELKVTQDPSGDWYFEPVYKKGRVHHTFDAETQNFSGMLRVSPVLDSVSKVVAYDVFIEDLAVDIPRAEIALKDNKRLMGHTQARIRDGKWRVESKSLFGLFDSEKEWVGSGTIELVNLDNHLALVDEESGNVTEFNGKELETTFQISLIRFNPMNISGSLQEVLKRGSFEFENDLFQIQTDVSGGVTIDEAQFPLVSFHSENDLKTDEALPETEILAPPEEQKERDVEAMLDEIFRPFMETVLESPRSVFQLQEIDLGSELAVKGADSLTQFTVDIDHAQLYADGDYRIRYLHPNGDKVATLPLIQGFFSFLNPRIHEGTELHLSKPNTVVSQNQLQSIEWSLNKSVHFLGFNIKGFAIDEPRKAVADKKSARFFVLTNHYRFNPICLLKLRYPFKMKGFYKRVNQRFKEENRDLRLNRNEVPTDLGDLMVFLDELMETLGLDKKIKQQHRAQYKKFHYSEFQGIKREELDRLEKNLEIFPETRVPNHVRKPKEISNRLNSLAALPVLVDSFTEEMINNNFIGDTKSLVLDFIEEVHLIREPLGSFIPKRERQKIRRINNKLLRLYLDEVFARPKIFDYEDLERLAVESDFKFLALDAGMVKITEDNEHDVSLDVVYMPHERDDRIDETDETPYLAVHIANEGPERIEDVEVNFINREVFFQGEFDTVAGIELYLAGPLEENASLLFKVREFDSEKDLKIVYVPEGYKRPAFALVTSDHGHRHDNIIEGGDLFISRQDGNYVSGLTFHHALVHEGYLYFTDQDEVTHEITDAFIDQTAAEYRDFKIQLGLKMLPAQNGAIDYDFDSIVVKGGLALSDHPDAIPRAYFFTGTNEDGKREYVELTRVSGDGIVDTDWPRVSYAGNIMIDSEIPYQFLEHPAVLALEDQGFEINLEGVEVAGSLEFTLEGYAGSVVRLPESKMPVDFIPTVLTLKGEITFELDGKMVTVKDLKIPIQQLELEVVTVEKDNGDTRMAPIVKNFEIPSGEEVEATVSAQLELPQNIGSGVVGFQDADFKLVSESDIVFGMEDPETVRLTASGVQATVQDKDFHNTLNLEAGELYFYDEDGTIQNWKITAEFEELIRAVVGVSLHGDKATFGLKL